MKLHVGNLDCGMNEIKLRKLFGHYGDVVAVTILVDPETGHRMGSGLVEFASEQCARAAIAGLDGKTIEGHSLVVNEYHPFAEFAGAAKAGDSSHTWSWH